MRMRNAAAIVRRTIVLSLVPVFALVAGAQAACSTAVGNGVPKSAERTVPAFQEVDIAGSLTVDITGGAPQKVTISADENILPYVHVEVRENTLRLWTEGNLRTTQPIAVSIRVPELHGVDISGSSRVSVSHIQGERLAIDTSGSSNVTLSDLTLSGSLSVESSGSGHIVAKGRASEVSVESSGSADIDTLDVPAETVSLEVSGSGDFKVHATGSLNIEASGSATIGYRGSPRISFEKSGSASVHAL